MPLNPNIARELMKFLVRYVDFSLIQKFDSD